MKNAASSGIEVDGLGPALHVIEQLGQVLTGFSDTGFAHVLRRAWQGGHQVSQVVGEIAVVAANQVSSLQSSS